MCRISAGVRSSFIVKLLFGAPTKRDTMNTLKCPILVGTLLFKDMLLDNSFLPPFPSLLFPEGFTTIFLKVTVRAKLRGRSKQSMVMVYGYRVQGIAYDSDKFDKLDSVINRIKSKNTTR